MARKPGKKRRHSSSKPSTRKRAKTTASVPHWSASADSQLYDVGSNDEITLRNSQSSPLLRLPAEIRNMIWAYAFGNRTLHPFISYKGKLEAVEFWPCEEKFPSDELYSLTQMGPDEREECIRKMKLRHPSFSFTDFCGNHAICGARRQCPIYFDPFLLNGFVCRQMWAEVLPVKWRTTTFCFTFNSFFLAFVAHAKKRIRAGYQLDSIKSGDDCLSVAPIHLIKEITLRLRAWEVGWAAALTPTKLEPFHSLVGIHLILDLTHWLNYNIDAEHLMDPKNWPREHEHILHVIREFRVLKLRSDRTTVWMSHLAKFLRQPHDEPQRNDSLKPEELMGIAERLREVLLDWKPRRRSGRRRF